MKISTIQSPGENKEKYFVLFWFEYEKLSIAES